MLDSHTHFCMVCHKEYTCFGNDCQEKQGEFYSRCGCETPLHGLRETPTALVVRSDGTVVEVW